MKQSRIMSLVKSAANVAIGFWIAVLTQMLVLPLFGLEATMRAQMSIGAIFTLVSLVRSYALRRVFEALRERKSPPEARAARAGAAPAALRAGNPEAR